MNDVFEVEPHVRACVEGGEVIFLDLRRDRYWRVSKAAAPAIANVVAAGSAKAAPTLVGHSLIRPRENENGAGVAAQTYRKPRAALELSDVAASTLGMRLAFFWSCLAASLILRSRRLDALFALLGSWKRRANEPTRAMSADASAFEALRPWWPAQRVCLFDSIALNFFLRARGHAPDLVVGVRTGPFAAHCWVEADGVVVGDTLEQCVAFTPIARA